MRSVSKTMTFFLDEQVPDEAMMRRAEHDAETQALFDAYQRTVDCRIALLAEVDRLMKVVGDAAREGDAILSRIASRITPTSETGDTLH